MPSTPIISPSLSLGALDPAARSGTPTQTDFLKLLVTQLSHQDPLSPQSDTEFVAQLANFAALEQAQNQSAMLKDISDQLGAQAGGQAMSLIGREVTARFDSIALDGAKPDPLQFTLDSDASSVTLNLRDARGNVVRTLKTGALKAGAQAVTWDGRGNGNQPLPAGIYQVEWRPADPMVREDRRPHRGPRAGERGVIRGRTPEPDGGLAAGPAARRDLGLEVTRQLPGGKEPDVYPVFPVQRRERTVCPERGDLGRRRQHRQRQHGGLQDLAGVLL